MVEIALCIAIIGFALVAIIGVLPAAMRVQQDNRGDTLIDQDGNYFMEAIRHGAQGLDQLTKSVYEINFVEWDGQPTTIPKRKPLDPLYQPPTSFPRRLIGALSVPYGTKFQGDEPFFVIATEAKVHAISGAAVEKDTNSLVSFDYLLTSEVRPFDSLDMGTTFQTARTNDLDNIRKDLGKSLHEIRLTFGWPIPKTAGAPPTNRKVFRALVSGSLLNATNDFFFFQPTTFHE